MNLRAPIIALAIAILILPAMATPTNANTSTSIAPGDYIVTGNAGCTLNFVYDGIGSKAGKVYMGTASHCVGYVGQTVRAPGFSNNLGTVAFKAYSGSRATDYAFIEIHSTHHSKVTTDVRGIAGSPTGATTSSDILPGDIILNSGHGIGYSITSITRENRAGTLTYYDGSTYGGYNPTIFGDSGGPIVHQRTGKALGIVSGLDLGFRCCGSGVVAGAWDVGATVEGIIAHAAANGFTVALR